MQSLRAYITHPVCIAGIAREAWYRSAKWYVQLQRQILVPFDHTVADVVAAKQKIRQGDIKLLKNSKSR